MAINQTPQQNFGYGFMNQGQNPMGMNYSPGPQPSPMMNYGQPMNNTGNMNMSSQPGLSVVSVTSDEQITNYPVASGNTVEFINFNTNRLCFKSTNQNGVPMPLRWATFSYDEQQAQNKPQNFNNQNDVNSVSREEFDELRSMMVQTLGMLKEQQDDRQYRPRKNTYNNGGKRNDRSENVSADDQ